MLQLLGDFVPETPNRRSATGPCWGTPVLRPIGLPARTSATRPLFGPNTDTLEDGATTACITIFYINQLWN